MDETAAFLRRCRDALGEAGVVIDPDLTAAHVVDWTGRWRGHAMAVLRPRTVDDVVAVVRAARHHGVALVPQGGNTSLVGGATPMGGEAVVDLRHLDTLDPVDVAAAQVTVGAGVTLGALQRHLAGTGLAFGVDLGARDTATIGGMVATNAGGLHVVRHGSMRRQVLGVEAVLGTGAVVAANLAGLVKDNTGYDLPGLLCGSEGTLGLVTRVRLRLVPEPADRVVALLGFSSTAAAFAALPALRRSPRLNAVELMVAAGMEAVGAHLGEPVPLQPVPAAALVVELAGTGDLLAELGAVVDGLGSDLEATAVATDRAAQARLWRWRELHSEAASAIGLVHKADVTVPLDVLAAFADEVPAVVQEAVGPTTTFVYGHLGDGNLHVNVVGLAPDDDRAIDAVLARVVELGGSVSAEHGIGVAKRQWLGRQRGETAVDAMRAIKSALDPDGILNPGVLLPAGPQPNAGSG